MAKPITPGTMICHGYCCHMVLACLETRTKGVEV
jgi:hypothetical protein